MLRQVDGQVLRGLGRNILRRHGRALPNLGASSALSDHHENVIMLPECWKNFAGALLTILRLTVITS